jgi:hypothetical protein
MRASKNARTTHLEQAALAGWRSFLPQVAAGDLDIAIGCQLATPQLALDNQLKPCPLKMECLGAPLRRWALIEKRLEHASANPDGALVWPEDHRKFYGLAVAIPASVFWKLEK